ncbi:MAG TPA: di-trans,poly-cis-decaprenylcistransferase [Bryobacteraceae bacterium]|jgi:undecaprenyl diphosphate synthase|nr:di-trans,poly-cis-decaprenylcistransferase [Bryobacteraceae bacterium]
MSQRTSGGLHAAIIMDGNGRWATTRGLPRVAGHRAGAEALRRTVEAAPDLDIGILTVYAFSSDNWQRPTTEVSALMKMFHSYLRREQAECVKNGVRVSVIGRRDRLPRMLLPVIESTEKATAAGKKLHLRLAVDYSSRHAILKAARKLKSTASRDHFTTALGGLDVDLLIRTGGEKRLSDFLLWECAYAELVFTPVMWPDFSASDLGAAVAEFHSRERRFGAVPAAALA